MNLRSAAVTVCGMLLAAAAVLWLFERQISAAWFRLGVQPEITAHLEKRGVRLQTIEDVFWMWQVIDRERVARKLGIAAAELDAEDFFDRIFPADTSLSWISDRF